MIHSTTKSLISGRWTRPPRLKQQENGPKYMPPSKLHHTTQQHRQQRRPQPQRQQQHNNITISSQLISSTGNQRASTLRFIVYLTNNKSLTKYVSLKHIPLSEGRISMHIPLADYISKFCSGNSFSLFVSGKFRAQDVPLVVDVFEITTITS